jgi:hypothetical protein
MRKILMFFLSLALMAGMAQAATPVVFNGDSANPGADTSSDNDENNALWDALGGGWDHINGSDEWDGTGIGVGNPGGVSALMDGTTDYIRIQDTGAPRDYGMGDPSNRKVWLAHQIDFGLDGARLEFRARVATGAPLDMQHPDGGGGVAPWPAGGKGMPVQNNGKGHFGIAEAGIGGGALDGSMGFSLALQEELSEFAGYENITTDVLLLNEWNPANQDGTDTGATGTPSYVPVNDATAWHTFVIDIAKLVTVEDHEYRLSISVDGAPAVTRDVTAATGLEYSGLDILHMGSSATGGYSAYDIDYFKAIPEPMTLSLLGLGGLALLRRRR